MSIFRFRHPDAPATAPAAVHQATLIALDAIGGKDAPARRLALANRLLAVAREESADALGAAEASLRAELLLHVVRPNALAEPGVVPRRPATPLTRSAARDEP